MYFLALHFFATGNFPDGNNSKHPAAKQDSARLPVSARLSGIEVAGNLQYIAILGRNVYFPR